MIGLNVGIVQSEVVLSDTCEPPPDFVKRMPVVGILQASHNQLGLPPSLKVFDHSVQPLKLVVGHSSVWVVNVQLF